MATKNIVIGHKNPDSDSVLSAILAAKFSKKIFGFEAESRIAGNVNNETKYVLDLAKEKKPKMIDKIGNENVVLVDTTEPAQIIEGLTEENLVGIVDHHNLGGLKTSKAIYVRVENIGCTCSLIYKILKEKNVKPDKKSALIIMAGIVSDTLNLTSPTSTSDDKKFLKELAGMTKINVKDFAAKIFAAKSSLKGISLEKVVEGDYKGFDMNGKKVGIGVWETTNPESINEKAEKIIQLLKIKKVNDKLDYMLFGVVDIIKNNSYCYIIGESERKLVKNVFSVDTKNGMAILKGVVSRKKQMVPPLMDYLAR